jgi:hypothetical protein
VKYRKKPVVIDAERWFKNGDHSADDCGTFTSTDGATLQGEGRVVRYFRRPDVSGQLLCAQCAACMHEHGWIDTLEGGHIVCPGDYIITGVKGERYPCKPDIFDLTYEPVEAAAKGQS